MNGDLTTEDWTNDNLNAPDKQPTMMLKENGDRDTNRCRSTMFFKGLLLNSLGLSLKCESLAWCARVIFQSICQESSLLGLISTSACRHLCETIGCEPLSGVIKHGQLGNPLEIWRIPSENHQEKKAYLPWWQQRVNSIHIPLNQSKPPLNHYKIPLKHYKIPLRSQ